ncbi:MAG: DUF3325 family protein [Ottowia sp.]|nr:DUF3325 family protein [Ottowia sp.]
MTHLGIFLLCLAGFAALALATDRAQGTLLGRELPPATTRKTRIAGWVLLLLALWLSVAARGWGLGLVFYSGHTSAAAGVVFLALVAWGRRSAR